MIAPRVPIKYFGYSGCGRKVSMWISSQLSCRVARRLVSKYVGNVMTLVRRYFIETASRIEARQILLRLLCFGLVRAPDLDHLASGWLRTLRQRSENVRDAQA